MGKVNENGKCLMRGLETKNIYINKISDSGPITKLSQYVGWTFDTLTSYQKRYITDT